MSFDNIKLDRELYTSNKSFTSALEELDPSENYRGTALEGLDAFERQLKRYDIKVSGRDSDTISKFYSTSGASVLFPEYITRAVQTGIAGNSDLEKVIATTTVVDSLDYRSIMLDDTAQNYALSEVAEGAAIPEMTISVKNRLTHLTKYGKMLVASYEAIKFQKLDIFSLTLKRIGETISSNMFNTAISTLENTDVGIIETPNAEFTYEDLIKLWTSFDGYSLTTLITSKNTMSKILALPEFRDANAGLDFHGTGRLITPFGAELISNSLITDDIIVGLDKSYALEKVVASDVTTEFDKLIDRQLERSTVSTIVGFSPIFSGAIKFLEKNV